MLISDDYKKLNEELHSRNKHYGTTGGKWAKHILGLTEKLQTHDVLDYGCGKSTLAMNLPFDIKQYDPAIEKYKDTPEPADIVICTDVLEHIEPDCILDVIKELRRLTKKMLILSIHNGPAQKTLSDGRNAHLIQEYEAWWLTMLFPHFCISQFSTMRGDTHSEQHTVLEYTIAATPI